MMSELDRSLRGCPAGKWTRARGVVKCAGHWEDGWMTQGAKGLMLIDSGQWQEIGRSQEVYRKPGESGKIARREKSSRKEMK